jgi:putative membrane protein
MTDSSASQSTQLAFERTVLAHERTLMAWVRTATAMISFGFTIYKFFDYLRQNNQIQATPHLFGPRAFALSMIGVGLIALVLATLEHRRSLAALQRSSGVMLHRSLSQMIALFVAAVGILGLVLVILRQ